MRIFFACFAVASLVLILWADLSTSATPEAAPAAPAETESSKTAITPVVKKAVPVIPKKPESQLTIIADRIESEGKTGITRAWKNVIISFEEKRITGNEAEYKQETGRGVVNGNVHYTDPDTNLHGSKMTFESNGERGVMTNARGIVAKGSLITGKRLERLSRDHYLIKDGSFTTCREEVPHWAFHAAETDMTIEEYALMEDTTVRIKDVPVFYTPWFVAPIRTKRTTGLLRPSFGVSSRNGVLATNSFFWAIAENADTTLTHKYLGAAGNEVDGELRYIFPGGIEGNINAEYLKETDPDRPQSRDLWKLRADHSQSLPYGFSNQVHIDIESENSLDREYGDDQKQRTRRYSDSWVNFNRTWTTRNINLTARQRKSTVEDSEETISTAPDITFNNQKQKLFGSPVYGALASSYISYRLESKPGGGIVTDTFDVNRLDINPSLSLPLTLAPWLSLQPALGFRSTWYSNGLDETGQQLEEGFSREFYTASLAITGPKLNKIFYTDSKTRPKLKHLIVPSLTWDYLPGLDFDGEDRQKVRIIDGIDQDGITPRNLLTLQIDNQLLAKNILGKTKSSISTLLKLAVAQSYDINEAGRTDIPDEDKRPLSPVEVDLDTNPTDWLLLNYESAYNTYDQFWESAHLELGLRYEDTLHMALDRTYKWGKGGPDAVWDTLYLEVNTPWKISANYSAIYNETDKKLTESVMQLKYKQDCWSFTLSANQRLITNPEGELEDERLITFTVTLLGVGDILGSKGQVPLAGRKL